MIVYDVITCCMVYRIALYHIAASRSEVVDGLVEAARDGEGGGDEHDHLGWREMLVCKKLLHEAWLQSPVGR